MPDARSETKLRSTTPVFLVRDVAATMEWYRDHLGFETDGFPKSPPHAFGILMRNGVEIMLQQLAGYEKPNLYSKREGGVWNAYVRITGIHALYEGVLKSSAIRVLEPIKQQWYGDTEFVIEDLNGYVLVFSELE